MQPKTEELMNLLLWTADSLTRPMFRNLTEGYENWSYRNGLARQVVRLERGGWLEQSPDDDRQFRLTAKARVHAMGGRDPEAEWARPWDGQWYMILFDIPNDQNTQRVRLRRYLKEQGFGLVQNSVWVSAKPLDTEAEILNGGRANVGSMLLLKASPCAGESDTEIVQTAWDFDVINERYAEHDRILEARPNKPIVNEAAAERMQEWSRQERLAWISAVKQDPLLPDALHPKGYAGPNAWRKRRRELTKVAKLMRDFTV